MLYEVITQLAFKTSKYSTYQSKMNAYLGNLTAMKRRSNNQDDLAYNSLEITYEGEEAFDSYDLESYNFV